MLTLEACAVRVSKKFQKVELLAVGFINPKIYKSDPTNSSLKMKLAK